MSIKHAMNVRSDFSIGESTLQIDTIIERAKELGYESVALVDTMSVSAMVNFTNKAKKAGIKPIIGCTLRVYDDPTYKKPAKASGIVEKENLTYNLKVYVQTEEGLHSLLKLLSKGNSEENFYYNARVGLEDVLALTGVAVSTGDFYSVFHHPDAEAICYSLFTRFMDDFYVELVPINTPLFDTLNAKAVATAEQSGSRTLITYPTLYDKPEHADTLTVLKAICTNTKMNAPWHPRQFVRDFYFRPPNDIVTQAVHMGRRLATASGPVLKLDVTVAQRLADSVTYEFKKLPNALPVMATNEFAAMTAQIAQGWKLRFSKPVLGHQPSAVDLETIYKPRLTFELGVLKKMGFSGYFLLVRDIVQWAKESNIIVGPGRGSAGGSLVSYLLGITDVDPIRFDLLFERFINPDRIDLPDADLDFMSSRRHEVVDRIIAKYGQDKVAGISNYSTLASASALRDTGRVHDVDNLELSCTKLVPSEHGVSVDLTEAANRVPEIDKFKAKHPVIWQHSLNLEGCMRTLGKHAAGIVVSNEPIVNRAVVETRSGAAVVNWDKKFVEDWGLIKMDILGLSTLDLLELGRQYVRERHGHKIDYLSLPLDDPKVLRSFADGHTTGVFQFESSGMRGLLKQLANGGDLTFDNLAATTALFRPGPLDAGLCDDYVAIKQGAKTAFLEHPNMAPALKDTYGVIVYQEQVMRVAVDVAGFTLTESDHLRKAMGKKDKDLMAEQRDKFVSGCVRVSGMAEKVASALFDKIEVFAGYAFNKSHAVEYSVISYWCMWLKVTYPAEFFAAAMSVVDDEDKLTALMMDARRLDIRVLPPDINISTERIEIADDTTLTAPFQAVKGISTNVAGYLVKARKNLGRPFVSRADMEALIAAKTITGKINALHRERLQKVGAFVSCEGGIPALHPDRLKDRLELMPGFTIDAVKASRTVNNETIAITSIIRLMEDCRVCDKCSLKGEAHPLPRMGKSPKFMVVFDYPNWEEAKAGRMLEGDAAGILKACLKDVGLTANDAYYTSLVKSPKQGKGLTNEQINGCVPYLQKEIEILKPPVILTLGSNATRYFMPGMKGSPMDLVGKVTFDPKLDASIVFGLNVTQIVFDATKLKFLETACAKVADLLS